MNPADRSSTSALLVALAVGVMLASIMPATMLWDRDEPLYARTALEMLQSGNWMLPTFNGEVFAHKPPLIYWLMAAGFFVFGESEFAARFVSAPGLAGSAYLTFLIGRRMFNSRVGFWAMTILSTSFLSIYLGTVAMLDTVLLFFICLSTWSYIELAYGSGRRRLMTLLFGLGLALAMLTKGPVGPAVVLSMVAAAWLAAPKEERPSMGQMAALVFASALAFAIFLAWAIPANRDSGGELVRTGVIKHIVERALQPMEGHGGSGLSGYFLNLPFYLPVIFVGFLPWTLHLPAALYSLASGRLGGRRERVLLWSGLLTALVLFTLAATKLPHYILPVFPALSLVVAAMLDVDALDRARASVPKIWQRAGVWFYAACVLGFAVLVGGAGFALPTLVSWKIALPIALVIGVACIRITVLQLRGETVKASRSLVVASPLTMICIFWLIVPRLEPAIKVSKSIGEVIRSQGGDEVDVFVRGYNEPSLVFYLNKPHHQRVRLLPADEKEAIALLDQSSMAVVVVTKGILDALQSHAGGRPFEIIGRFSARNTNNGGNHEEVMVASRGPSAGRGGTLTKEAVPPNEFEKENIPVPFNEENTPR